MAGQLVLLLHGATEDLLHAAADHGHCRHDEPQQVVPHREIGYRSVHTWMAEVSYCTAHNASVAGSKVPCTALLKRHCIAESIYLN